DDDVVMSIPNKRIDAITVFAAPGELVDWMKSLYPTNYPLFIHQSAVLIELITDLSVHRRDNPLYIYVDRFKLHILSCRQGKLIYYNQFIIRQFSDYIKYIMLVLRSLNLDQQQSKVLLWGYIGTNSPHYKESYKYISTVTFGQRPRHLNYGYMFDEVQG